MAVFLIVAVESLGIPFPGETTLVIAAGYAGASHHLQIAGVIIAASAGAIIGDNIGYLIGHWGGYRLLIRYGRYVRLDQAKVKVARYLFRRRGGTVVFFGRFISILRAYAAFLAGTSRMPWARFLAFNAAGGILWASLYGTGAYLLGNEFDRIHGPLVIGFGIVAGVGVIALVLVIRRQERRLEAVAERALPGPLEGYPGGPEL